MSIQLDLLAEVRSVGFSAVRLSFPFVINNLCACGRRRYFQML